MKARLIGLAFMFAVCCLMCLPFIVSSETQEQAPEPQRTLSQAEAALITAQATGDGILNIRETDAEKKPLLTIIERDERVSGPTADANGLPILRTSYIRSNYQAFCLTGNGG